MSIADWLIVAAVGGYLLWLLFRPKKHSCCGSCEGCTAHCGKERS